MVLYPIITEKEIWNAAFDFQYGAISDCTAHVRTLVDYRIIPNFLNLLQGVTPQMCKPEKNPQQLIQINTNIVSVCKIRRKHRSVY